MKSILEAKLILRKLSKHTKINSRRLYSILHPSKVEPTILILFTEILH